MDFSFTNCQESINYQMTEGCLIEIMGCVDLKDFREIWQKHIWDNNEPNCVSFVQLIILFLYHIFSC